MPFYAVRFGKIPGIYTTWEECKKQVTGVKGSIYKKFNDKSSAKKFCMDRSKSYKKKPICKNNITKTKTKKQEQTHIKSPNTLYIFTDGSSTNNGSKRSTAGYGIYISEPSKIKMTISHRLPNGTTNNYAELKAILEALKLLDPIDLSKLNIKNTVIVTDSQYSINCITKWYTKWVKQDWRSSTGTEVKNKKLIQDIHPLYKKYNVTFKHINSHTGKSGFFYEGNCIADKLASNTIL